MEKVVRGSRGNGDLSSGQKTLSRTTWKQQNHDPHTSAQSRCTESLHAHTDSAHSATADANHTLTQTARSDCADTQGAYTSDADACGELAAGTFLFDTAL